MCGGYWPPEFHDERSRAPAPKAGAFAFLGLQIRRRLVENDTVDQQTPIFAALGVAVAIMAALAIYTVLEMVVDPTAFAAEKRPAKGVHEATVRPVSAGIGTGSIGTVTYRAG
jgi:hypothetical protein